MKQLMMLMLAVVISAAAIGQGKNVNKANTAFTKGELAEALALIEPATQDEKTKDKGRTWYIRGQIYGAIAGSDDQSVRDIAPDAYAKAAESYLKVIELEKDGSNYKGLAQINYDNLKADVLNSGVQAYQEDNFQGAYDSFKTYQEVSPEDTTGYIYAALMAQQLEDYETLVAEYDKLFALGYYPKSALNQVIYYNLNNLEKPEAALEYVNLAQEQYPEDNDFQKTAVDVYIKLDKMDDAINELQEAIALEPNNAKLYSNLGMLYDSQGDLEKARVQYEKALEIDPSDRFSLINLAVFYIGLGDDINKKAIEMDMATFRKEGDKVEAQARAEWKKAIPLLEKVLEGDDTDELALQNLHAVYYKLKDAENAKKVEKKRKDLGYIVE
jgi:tetratricopeptide (TPR) repeat protein